MESLSNAPILFGLVGEFYNTKEPRRGAAPYQDGEFVIESGMLSSLSVKFSSDLPWLATLRYLMLEITCKGILISRSVTRSAGLYIAREGMKGDEFYFPVFHPDTGEREFVFPGWIYPHLYGTTTGYPIRHTVRYVLECEPGTHIQGVHLTSRPVDEVQLAKEKAELAKALPRFKSCRKISQFMCMSIDDDSQP